MTHFFPLTIGALFAGTLLSSCSHSSSTAESGDGSSAPTAATERNTGTKADSLNGIPSHQFGEPLSAFPGMVLARGQQPGSQTYTYPEGKLEGGWFGKHKKEVGFTFYVFREGKFVSFIAYAFGPGREALEEEANYLFGAGRSTGLSSAWRGQNVEVDLYRSTEPAGPALILNVSTKSHKEALARAEADQLKADNEQ